MNKLIRCYGKIIKLYNTIFSRKKPDVNYWKENLNNLYKQFLASHNNISFTAWLKIAEYEYNGKRYKYVDKNDYCSFIGKKII